MNCHVEESDSFHLGQIAPRERLTVDMILTSGVQTMSSREIAELVKARHDSVKRSMERMAASGVISFTPAVETSHDGAGARPIEVYTVGERDSYVVVAQMSPEFTGALVDRWKELEQSVKKAVALPNFMDPAESARAWALEFEAKKLAMVERDEAIRTKAHISDKKTATAMATASHLKRENNKLKDDLGFSSRNATNMQVESALGGDFSFLPLRNWCKANEVIPKTVPDKRYPNGVKAWPAGAWRDVYGVKLAEIFPGEVA